MTNIYDQYKRIRDEVEEYIRRLKNSTNELLEQSQKYKTRIDTIKDNGLEALSDIESKIARTKAFIDIARTHTETLNESDIEIEYNHSTLSKLAVQINSGKANDKFATKLYTEATGQMKYLERQKQVVMNNERDATSILSQDYDINSKEGEKKVQGILMEAASFLQSSEVRNFFSLLSNRIDFRVRDREESLEEDISIGTVIECFPIIQELKDVYREVGQGAINIEEESIELPAVWIIEDSRVGIFRYTNETEPVLLQTIQTIITNYAMLNLSGEPKVYFFDPVRLNSSALGALSEFCGDDYSLINEVPRNTEEIRDKLKSIINELNQWDLYGNGLDENKLRLFIFHNYPDGYDSSVVAQIQQLCVNASHYGINVIVTNNFSEVSSLYNNTLSYMETFAFIAGPDVFMNKENNKAVPFRWCGFNGAIPDELVKRYIVEKPLLDRSNIYENRVGFSGVESYKKGFRYLDEIPYGIDGNGDLQRIGFENTDFATFICGASRSGKSTLLHTLITGLIKNYHPDDIEMWLIDFKMTEFSRYTNHLPPHVRYIILDESPELVYDIINRLTEILQKRQNIFKGKWLKLSDVPRERYMPSIMVVIDEFSVMSQIIADSIVNSKENYAIKLQTLLAKGAALGIHFIFASQGFTSGTRGLNDFSKKQIQQRLAMKTEYNEIRETLDLKSASDDDKAMMEQLPVHHVLTRHAIDNNGNHLKSSKVLFISDYESQERMIDGIARRLNTTEVFEPENNSSYIYKQPMIIDGNVYIPFIEKEEKIHSYLNDERIDKDNTYLFLGEPRRMLPLYPVEVVDGFGENLLLVSPVTEKMPVTSIFLSIKKSLEMQNKSVEIWADKKNGVLKQLNEECGINDSIAHIGCGDVCKRIRKIKADLEKRERNDKYIILLGIESLLLDMSLESKKESSEYGKRDNSLSSIFVEKRAPDEPDLLTLLASADKGLQQDTVGIDVDIGIDITIATKGSNLQEVSGLSESYDARDDLKQILTLGPKSGCHFIVAFSSVGELKQSKLDLSLFKHKVMFRTARSEALEVIGSGGSSVVSELEDHAFRYTNGIEAVSFRPYLHKGVTWDGWTINDDGVADAVIEEEYLL